MDMDDFGISIAASKEAAKRIRALAHDKFAFGMKASTAVDEAAIADHPLLNAYAQLYEVSDHKRQAYKKYAQNFRCVRARYPSCFSPSH